MYLLIALKEMLGHKVNVFMFLKRNCSIFFFNEKMFFSYFILMFLNTKKIARHSSFDIVFSISRWSPKISAFQSYPYYPYQVLLSPTQPETHHFTEVGMFIQ